MISKFLLILSLISIPRLAVCQQYGFVYAPGVPFDVKAGYPLEMALRASNNNKYALINIAYSIIDEGVFGRIDVRVRFEPKKDRLFYFERRLSQGKVSINRYLLTKVNANSLRRTIRDYKKDKYSLSSDAYILTLSLHGCPMVNFDTGKKVKIDQSEIQ